MTEVAFRSAAALAAAIHRRELGSRELLEHYLARVDRHNAALNAIIVTDLERARRRADEADAALARGENWGPLHGLPMTVKESFDVIGMPTTWGLPELEGNLPPANALAVDRLFGAGAVIFGKTNVPVMLADSQSYKPVFDPGRLLRRGIGGAGRRTHRARNRQRHRRLDPQPGPLLRRLRAQAELRHRAATRPVTAGQCRSRRHISDWAVGAQRRRYRPGARHHRRA